MEAAAATQLWEVVVVVAHCCAVALVAVCQTVAVRHPQAILAVIVAVVVHSVVVVG